MHDPQPTPDLQRLFDEIEPGDFERIEPPESLWAGIEAAITTEPVRLEDHRRRARSTWVLAAAAAVVAVVAIGGVLASSDGGSETVVATATIVNDGLEVPNPDSGTARLLEVDDHFEIELDVPELPDADGFYEVWIIDTDVEGMFSLGVVRDDGRFVLPTDVDPFDFPVVDVSLEPLDGNPLHSGRSVWRGVLETT